MPEELSRSALYDSKIPRQLSFYTELIVEVCNEIIKPSWSAHSDIEIGFYKKDKVTKSELFFGIWYEI